MPPLTTASKNYLSSGGALRNGQIPNQQLVNGEIVSRPIGVADLSQPSQPLTVPPAPIPSNPRPVIDSSLESILAAFNATSPTEQAGSDLQARLLSSIETLGGKKARSAELEKEAGLPVQRQQLQDILGQLQGLQKEAAAIPISIQEESLGRGRTAAGVAPIEAGRLRQNAIRALGLASIGQTLQGNIALAESSIARAISMEFEPEETRLKLLTQLYEFNKDALVREDSKRATALNSYLNERTRILETEKANKEEIYKVGSLAGKYGADTATVQKIFNAKSREEAVVLAGQFLQDPQAKQDLANAVLSAHLTRVNIAKSAYELDLLKQFGGMTPKEYAQSLKDEAAEIKAAKDEQEKARLQGQALGKKITLLDAVLSSKAIDSVVGPTIFSRKPSTEAERKATLAIPLIGPLLNLQGAVDQFTGSADALIGQTEQFISKEFLQNLIDVKAQGATFGALQKAEQDALTAAATFIGQRRICSNGNRGTCGENSFPVGYDMSESDFRREMETIRELTQIAFQRASGEAWAPDEQAYWDALESSQNSINFNPAY